MPQATADRATRFLILGSLEIWAGAERLQLGGPRQEQVLATLLLEANHVVPLSRLIDAAWDEQPPATAAHQVRKLVSDLRRRLPAGPETLVTDGPGYRAVIAPDRLDATRFEHCVARARKAEAAGERRDAVAQYQAALDLWRGPVMAGECGPVVASAATVLHERRLRAAERLVELRMELGESREVLDRLRALVAEHPLRESLRSLLMTALYRCGRRADALHEYETLRRTLSDELGIDPGPELAQLHQRILQDSADLLPPAEPAPPPPAPLAAPVAPAAVTPAAAAVTVPRTLPYDLPDFTGRGRELARILAAAEEPARGALRVIAIDGMGGSGKTTLAVHAAHALAEHYPDGQLYIDLCGFAPDRKPLHPAAALDVLLRTLGVPGLAIPDDPVELSALWRTATADRRLLILLDNAVDAAQVERLLPTGPGALVLITARARLTALDGAVVFSLCALAPDAALGMLAGVLGRERVEAEPDPARALVQLCGRLPLALRIAAARLHNRPQWTIADMVDRLRDKGARLDQLELGDRSVATMIGLSYDTLPEDRRGCFRLLGVHPGSDFEPWAVAAFTDLPAPRAESVLEDLLDARLLEQCSAGRYRFHDLVRSYAFGLAQKHDSPGRRDAAVDRLLEYYLAAAHQAADILQPGRRQVGFGPSARGARRTAPDPAIRDAESALAWFDREYPAILSALRCAAGRGKDRYTGYLPNALVHYLRLRGRVDELLELLETAVAAARRLGDGVLERLNLMDLAAPYSHLGRPWEALGHLARALEIATAADDRHAQAECLLRIGVQNEEIGHYSTALHHYEQALALYRRLGGLRGECATLIGLGSALATLGRHAEALEHAREAERISLELGDLDAKLRVRVNQASALAALSRLDEALQSLGEACELSRRTGAKDGQAVTLTRYTDVYIRMENFGRAAELGATALAAAEAIHRPALAAAVENLLATADLRRGDPACALERHERAARIAEKIDLRIELARSLDGAGHALAALGDHAAARENWRAALEHYEQMGVPQADAVREQLAHTAPPPLDADRA